MMNNRELLAVAISQLGNTGGKYRSYVGEPGSWCDMFVYWLFHANGCGELLNWTTKAEKIGCPSSIKWCEKNLAEIPPYLAMACDLVYYDWDKNRVPNHIGIVESHWTNDKIHAIEGNTSGGKVDRKDRQKYIQAVFRPHFAPTNLKKDTKLAEDSICGYNTIAAMEKWLGLPQTGILTREVVIALQKKVGADPDAAWGKQTSKKLQKVIGASQDGDFYKNSVLKLQQYLNKTLGYTKAAPKKAETKQPTKHSYRIEVDLTNQITTVYDNGKAVMSEFVSTARKGKTTPVGSFKIQGAKNLKAKYRTAKLSGGKSYAEFLVRFKGAKCMHTVPYSKRNTKGYVNKNEFNKLGTPRSAGCVRMPYKMAKFIYNNCPIGTPVKVFRGTAGSYPMGKPKKYTATSNVDPTK